MINDESRHKLREMNLGEIISGPEAQQAETATLGLPFEVGFYMKLNIHTDKDIIHWLWNQPSKQGSIKKLIREEIARNSVENTVQNSRSVRKQQNN